MSDKNGFLRNLFLGDVLEDKVFPYPRMKEEELEVVEMISDSIKRFGKEVDQDAIDQAEKLPPELLEKMKDMELFGLIIPEEYGGMGLSVSGYARVLEDLAVQGAAVGVTIGAHQSIGMKGLLLFGNETQKQHYLPKLASGEMLAGFCLTEPNSGSDAASIRTRAELSADGSHYLLNGEKQFITNGGLADFFTVFAKTPIEESGVKQDKITTFIVTRDLGGVSNGPEEKKLGWKGSSTTTVYFENVKVPVENVIGEVGKGFKVAMEILNNGRLSTSTASFGVARLMIDMSIKYAGERKQFGQNIGRFDMIKEKIAHMSMLAYGMQCVGYLTAGLADNGEQDYAIETAVAKVFSTEALWKICDEALQIHGGMGYIRELPIERFLRDARLGVIVEGTSEILRALIALEGLKTLGKFLKKHGLKGYAQKTFTPARMGKHHPTFEKEAGLFCKSVDKLSAYAMQLLRVYKKDVISKQLHQKRIAEAVIDLYVMAAMIARTSALLETGRSKEDATTEVYMTRSFCRMAYERIENLMDQFDLNHDSYLARLADKLYEDGAFLPKIADLGSQEASQTQKKSDLATVA
ncbi:MAG: acyl-CoA dehydrogenase [Candidatus Melainabacteria bacterium HGW-Melainabacteria-1]|nr:MAG: acyl-CoA dehydrogenase [Candidatus Melainabacteria bacterium HGW-Melainabacteria-1]